jgi:hypothetical protein
MEHEELAEPRRFSTKAIVAFLVVFWLVGGALGFYAVHEHRTAEALRTQAQQSDAALATTRSQVDDLSSKVNTLATQMQQQQQQQQQAAAAPNSSAPRSLTSSRVGDPRFKKMQKQLDAQGKAIDDTRTQIASTQGDLANTRTELTGGIARNHDDLVLLQKKGERNYYEFDIDKSKTFHPNGPFSIRLKKANDKHQYADLELVVDDRTVSQKHVNLYQPVMFYTPDSPQPSELVINSITKDRIHGYVSAPKYRQSELANVNANSSGTNGASSASNPTPVRQKLPAPQ